jgi:copper chaperone
MPAFRIDDMTCNHCAGAITQAVKAVDRDAEVTVDLAQHLVQIRSRTVNEQALSAAITEAGYTPVAVSAQPSPAATPKRSGCCCGSGRASCA